MKEIIAIVSRKGGSGKTTTAQSIGAALQAKKQRVLLIDLDAQCNLSASMGADLTGTNGTQLFETGANVRHAIQHTDNGDIIAGSKFFAGADAIITSNQELKRALNPLLPDYDYIIIDTPATYGRLTTNALTAATSAIITVKADAFSLQGIDELNDVLLQISETNKDLKLRGVIVTAYDGRSNAAKNKLDEFRKKAKAIKTRVIEPPIRATSKVFDSQDAQRNLIDFAPKATATQDYNDVADKVRKW